MYPVEADRFLQARRAHLRMRLIARVAIEDALSGPQRRAILLRYGLEDCTSQERSTREVARIENVSEVAIRARLEKAIGRLRECSYAKILLLGLFSLEN